MIEGDAHTAVCRHCPLTTGIAALLGRGQPAQERRVSHLLDPDLQRWVAGPAHALESVAERVLYRAVRDAVAEVAFDGLRWRADLVRYRPGILPTGELHRSLGHWNSSGQLEVFQTLSGTICLIMAADHQRVFHCLCGPGDVVAVPRGGWHLTYVISGPALVFNMYAETDPDDVTVKFGDDKPIRYWMRGTEEGPVIQPAPDGPESIRWRQPSRTRELLGGACLAAAVASGAPGSPQVLAALGADAEIGWPAT